MRILTLGFYVVVGALIAWFAARNWTLVTLQLWGDYELAIRLPVLMLLMFLIGVLPLAILQNINRWRLNRKVRRLERALADIQPAPSPSGAEPQPSPIAGQ